MESLDIDTWEISFGDFDMGVVDGNPGNQIHNIQVKNPILVLVRTFSLRYDSFYFATFYRGYVISSTNILPTL